MKVIKKKLDEIKEYPGNAKEHPPEQIEEIARSIKEYGFRTPMLLDKDSVIIEGHGRLKAALLLGLEEVDVIVASDLSEAQVKALRIADNKVAESRYDREILKQEIIELEAMMAGAFTGISEDELDEIFGNRSIFEEMDEKDEKHEREIPKMERMLNEHNDYIVFVFRNSIDFVRALEELKIKKVNSSLSEKSKKIGIGRVLDGKKLMEMINAKENHN